MTIRVAIADDHALVREGLQRMLVESPDIEIVGEAGDGQAALKLVEEKKPDVLLLDISMPKMDGIEAAGKIHTDLAKGFVRAEVYTYDELADAGGEKELKARGLIRLEAKGYVVRDGEIVHIRSAL